MSIESLQLPNLEYSIERNESCILEADNAFSCKQGRIALYSAAVESVEHIQKSVFFAKSKRLRISIRNTGHDYGGRSSAPGSFQILTSGLKGIKYTSSFSPATPYHTMDSARYAGPAVTIGAGVLTGELYSAAYAGGYSVVGGDCSTVGIAGGFIQSGGQSILSPSRGLGSDQLLEVEIVTADVSILSPRKRGRRSSNILREGSACDRQRTPAFGPFLGHSRSRGWHLGCRHLNDPACLP